jgi:hypothetical protein
MTSALYSSQTNMSLEYQIGWVIKTTERANLEDTVDVG